MIRLEGPKGKRELPLEKFFVIPKSESEREHDLRPNEIVTEVVISRHWRFPFFHPCLICHSMRSWREGRKPGCTARPRSEGTTEENERVLDRDRGRKMLRNDHRALERGGRERGPSCLRARVLTAPAKNLRSLSRPGRLRPHEACGEVDGPLRQYT